MEFLMFKSYISTFYCTTVVTNQRIACEVKLSVLRNRTGGLFSNSVELQTIAAAAICRFDASTKFEFEKR